MSQVTINLNQVGNRQQQKHPIPEDGTLLDKVIAVLKNIYDPELPVNIYDLGLIYEINIDGKNVSILMTLTTPNCPVAGSMPAMVECAIRELDGVEDVKVTLTWNPPWSQDVLSDEVKLSLGLL
jgi:FeS assembly SUF system protein